MKIAIAQIMSSRGDVEANVLHHLKYAAMAADADCQAVFFPELSITGYEPTLAEALATTVDDPRFEALARLSVERNIVIGFGFPSRDTEGVRIGMAICHPSGSVSEYAKQILHDDEKPFFVAGNQYVVLSVGERRLALAICYESLQTEHAQTAAEMGADVYIACVAKSGKGVLKAQNHYPAMAKKCDMYILMANSVGPNDDFISFGKSAIWSKNGSILAQMNGISEGILVFDTDTEGVEMRHF